MHKMSKKETAYLTDKYFAWLYLGTCLIYSLFICFEVNANAQLLVMPNEFVSSKNDSELIASSAILFRDAMETILMSYSQVVSIAIEPFFAIFVNAFAGLVNALLGLPIDMIVTPLSYPIVLFLFSIIVLTGKILLSIQSTQTFAMMTYSEIEKAIGYISILFLGVHAIRDISSFCNTNYASISALLGIEKTQSFIHFSTALCFIGSLFALSIYYIVKTVILSLKILQIPYAYLPGVSFLYECLKSFIVAVLCSVNLVFPIAGFLFNIMVSGIAVYLFLRCNYVVKFYRDIYLKPVFHNVIRKNNISKHKENPAWIDVFLREKEYNSANIFPVYIIHTPMKNSSKMRLYECWWFILTDKGEQILCRKTRFMPNTRTFIITNVHEMYYRENYRYLELFSLDGPKENLIKIFKKPQKDLHFIISHEYSNMYSSILEKIQYIDYQKVKEDLKQAETERRRMRVSEVKEDFIQEESKVIS